jgi:hypothetical protein
MMRFPIPLLILLLAPVFATACREAAIPPAPREVYVTVKAHLDAEAEPVFDYDYHHSELVRPGDKVSFACECDDGLELTVSEPKLAFDLEALESLIEKREGETMEAKLESLRGELEQAGAYLKKQSVPAGNGDNAYLEEQAVPAAGGDNRAFLQTFLADFSAVILDAPDKRLFDGPWRQPGFHPGNRSIGPFTVGPIERESMWKFTWTVRVQERPGSEVSWDPHLMGYPAL